MHPNYRKAVARRRRRGIFKKFVGVLCCIVVFCTTYALILPAITMENDPLCGKEIHEHSEECRQYLPGRQLICDLVEERCHEHGDGCFVPGETTPPVLHEHGPSCNSQGELMCSKETNHSHGAECFEQRISCEEIAEDHVHGEGCYTDAQICNLEEGHEHGQECYQTLMICGLEAGEPEPAEPAAPVLVCTEPEFRAHVHGDSCFVETEPQPVVVCGNENDGHIHEPGCYQMGCGLEAHEHTLGCYSDPEADVETAGVWEATFAGVALTGDRNTDVVAIAASQVGYTESTRNYEVGADNSIHGYTRYGAWYGKPYEKWDGMFASFCLNYAGVSGMSRHQDAQAWAAELNASGLYAGVMETKARKGWLVFLDLDGSGSADRVGIVADVQEAEEYSGSDIKVIEGDASNTVRYAHYTPADSRILGYGLLPGQERIPVVTQPEEETKPTEETQPVEETPIYFCGLEEHTHTEQCGTEESGMLCEMIQHSHTEDCLKEAETEDPDLPEATEVYIESSSESVMITYSAIRIEEPPVPASAVFSRNAPMPIQDDEPGGEEQETPTDPTVLTEYLVDHEGTLSLKLFETDGTDLPDNGQGGYNIEQGKPYLLSLAFSVQEGGMAPGTYVYQFPDAFRYSVQSGKLYDSDHGYVELGEWTLKPDGTMEFVFYKASNSYQSVALTATIRTYVKESVSTFDFDGTVYVVVAPEEEGKTDNLLNKFGKMDEEEPGRINWTVNLTPGTKEPVLGTVFQDTLETDLHYFSEADKAQGITIGFIDGGEWHQIVVQPEWIDDTGFTFVFPEQPCAVCQNTFQYTPGIKYHITYTTTVQDGLKDGYYLHKNGIQVGNQTFSGSAGQQVGKPEAYVVKDGELDPGTQDFKFSIQAKIPGYTGEERSLFWQLQDWSRIVDLEKDWLEMERIPLTLDNIESVTVLVEGTDDPITIPHVSQVTAQDPYCYYIYNDLIYLGAPCQCTEETCARYLHYGYCYTLIWDQDAAHRDVLFCICHTDPKGVLLTINMRFDGEYILNVYGGKDLTFVNSVALQGFNYDGPNSLQNPVSKNSYDAVPVPRLVKKEMLDPANLKNGFVAAFEITVNDSKMDLSRIGTDIAIVDTMSEFLHYIPGSMKITQVDLNNQSTTLRLGEDYIMNVSGHTITINLLRPGAYQYVLNYNAQVIAEYEPHPGYSNHVEVHIAANTYGAETDETHVLDYSYTASSFRVSLKKTCASSGQPLSGAVFGLFAQNGEEIARTITDENGSLTFATDLAKNVVFKKHTPYYLQEISAPEGYVLDETMHWFYICDDDSGSCEDCGADPTLAAMAKAPQQVIQVTNDRGGPVLPNTGGTGTAMFLGGGLALILAATALLYERKKSRYET